MKKILMTAVAVSALTAGAASAATLSTASTINSVNLVKTSSTAYEAYTIATETVTPGTATAVLRFVPSATGIAAGAYLVTWNVTGGTFGTVTSVAGTDLSGALGASAAQVCTVSSATTTSVVALCTSTAAVESYTLTVPVALGTAQTAVSVSGSITTQAGVAVDGGSITGGTIIDYRAGLKAVATAVPNTLSLASTFKKFSTTATDLNNAVIATAFGLNANDSATVGSDVVFLTPGTRMNAAGNIASLVSAASVTVVGDFGSFQPVLASATTGGVALDFVFTTGQSPATLGTGNMTVTGTNLASLTGGATTGGTAVVGLKQRSASTPVAGTQSSYTATIVPTMVAGYTAQTYAAATLGTVSFEGASFLAPWVGDGSNGITYTIRLANKTATAIPYATATLLNPNVTGTTGTAGTSGICNLGTIPASGELLVTSASLATCFGAFKRSDVTLTVGTGTTGASVIAGVTAKMRASAAGIVSDVTLGGGSTVATTN